MDYFIPYNKNTMLSYTDEEIYGYARQGEYEIRALMATAAKGVLASKTLRHFDYIGVGYVYHFTFGSNTKLNRCAVDCINTKNNAIAAHGFGIDQNDAKRGDNFFVPREKIDVWGNSKIVASVCVSKTCFWAS